MRDVFEGAIFCAIYLVIGLGVQVLGYGEPAVDWSTAVHIIAWPLVYLYWCVMVWVWVMIAGAAFSILVIVLAGIFSGNRA